MEKYQSLDVLYNDVNGVDRTSTIDKVNDDGTVNLLVFVSMANGFRADQDNVVYSATPTPNTWRNANT